MSSTERLLKAVLFTLFILSWSVPAQVKPSPNAVALTPSSSKFAAVPAEQAAFELPFILDPSSGGGDWLHVHRTMESTTVALRAPSGTLITSATAGGLGFQWMQATVAVSAEPDPDPGDGLGPDFSGIGTHLIIEFPASQPAGTYVLIFDATATEVETRVLADWSPNSMVVTGMRTDAQSYKVGDWVKVIALVSNDGQPIVNASVVGTATASREVTDAVVMGNPTLVDKAPLGNGMSQYRYRVGLQNNTNSSLSRFVAVAESFDEDVRVVDGVLGYPAMSIGSSALSEDAILVVAPTSPDFDPGTLDWDVTAKSAPITLSFTDVGEVNDLAGDGVFGTRFQTTETGEYSVHADITGTTATGTPFYRNAATEFTVIPALAPVASITAEGEESGAP